MISERGSVTVELVILTPLLMMLVLFGIYAGRASEAVIQVRHAADQAARAASKGGKSRIQSTAKQIAERALQNSGTSCTEIVVNSSLISQGEDSAVLVKVDCTRTLEAFSSSIANMMVGGPCLFGSGSAEVGSFAFGICVVVIFIFFVNGASMKHKDSSELELSRPQPASVCFLGNDFCLSSP